MAPDFATEVKGKNCSNLEGFTMFWEDLWNTEVVSLKYPSLFSFVKNQRISVKEVMETEDLDSLFFVPLSEQAFSQLHTLQTDVVSVPYNFEDLDRWTFTWGSYVYSSQKFYALAFRNLQVPCSFTWLWKSKCTPHIKFFGWLLLVDRLNTRNMLRRRNFHIDAGYSRVMCNHDLEEDIQHLFFYCPFATSCWLSLQIQWTDDHDIHAKLLSARTAFNSPFFMEIFLVAAWELWKIRNDRIFYQQIISRSRWLFNFKKQVHLQLLRVKQSLHPQIVQWLDTLV